MKKPANPAASSSSRGAEALRRALPVWFTPSAFASIPRPAEEFAKERQAMLTRPRGFRGVLQDLGTRLCDMYGAWSPPMPKPVAMAAGISNKE